MRHKETRALALLLKAKGVPEDLTDEVMADDDVWDQFRLWLIRTADENETAARFQVKARMYERVSAWGGEVEWDLRLEAKPDTPLLKVVEA